MMNCDVQYMTSYKYLWVEIMNYKPPIKNTRSVLGEDALHGAGAKDRALIKILFDGGIYESK